MSARRNVLLLAACQAVFVTGTVMVVSLSALVGRTLAPDPRLATLPAAIMALAAMATAMPASLVMQRLGRQRAFMIGVTIGGSGALVAAAALARQSFALYCLGSALIGVMAGASQYYRFAAADAAEPAERPRAISYVLAGGLVAAFVGPNLASWTRDAFVAAPFIGSFLALAALQLAALPLLAGLRLPRPPLATELVGGRSLRQMFFQPRYALAVAAGVTAYGTMNILMMATPLAMRQLGFEFSSTASVIQWHAVGMFAPAFVTGRWVERYGSVRIMLAGTTFLTASAITHLAGSSLWHFWIGLASLGVGWNLLFVAASSLLTTTHTEAEKARAQGLNDLLVFGAVAITALLSATLFESVGWEMMNRVVIAPLGLLFLACLWVGRKHPARPT